MTAAERQDLLVEEYSLIDDPRERFQLIVETAGSKVAPFPSELRLEEHLVPGCVSRVWMVLRRSPDGSLEVLIDSESSALAAIAALFRRIYSGAAPSEIVAIEPDFIARLGIDRQLTPTRLRGLRSLRSMLVEGARSLIDGGSR